MERTHEIITSRQNQYVSLAAKLQDRKHRQSEGLFRFDGVKLYAEAITRGAELCFVLTDDGRFDAADAKARALCGKGLLDAPCRVLRLSSELFAKISDENAPEGVICVAKYIDKFHKIATIYSSTADLEQLAGPNGGRLLLCESLRDPGNLGTVIRTAYAFGIDCLICSRDCADIYNPKTIRAAMGGLFRLSIDKLENTSMSEYIAVLRKSGRRVFAAALDDNASRLGELALSVGDCVVIGNEGHGLSEETVRSCDRSVIIPMVQGCESLNAAAAAVIFMWELRKTNKN